MRLISHWFIATAGILIAAYVLPGVEVTLISAVIAAVVLGALNLFIRPLLMALALPINLLTLGLFSLVINALLVLLAARLVPGFSVGGFWGAFFFAIVLALVNWVFQYWNRPANTQN
jgi:putative membrane protein